MAKTVIFNEADPCVSITLERVGPGELGRARGTHGTCTECGWPLFKWHHDKAVEAAQKHVDAHEPVTPGGDPHSLVQ
jgi:hypothetical protein